MTKRERKTVELLINRRSRTAGQVEQSIVDTLNANGIELGQISRISKKVSLDELVAGIKEREPDLLIVAGGDGTVSSALDRLVGSPIEIGIIPLGTTNNFARSLDIPLGDLQAAIANIRTSKARPVDLGLIDGDYFSNVAGVGLSARIASSVDHKLKQRWGRLAYLIAGVSQALAHKPFFVTIRDPDHELSYTFETRQLIVANGRFHAGRQIAADAKVDNGQLLIFPLGGRSLWSLVIHTLDFYLGKRKKVIHSSYFVGKKVEIHTDRPQPIELDGEAHHETSVLVSVERAALKVRY